MNYFYPLIAIILLPGALIAQTDTTMAFIDPSPPGTWEVFAGGGLAFPFRPESYEIDFKQGYSWMAGAGYSMPAGDFGYGEVNAWFQYGNTPFDEAEFISSRSLTANYTVESSQGDVFLGMVGFRGVFATSKSDIAPYFTVGGGFYHLALPEIYVTGPTQYIEPGYEKSTFGWTVGAGVDVPIMDRIILFADGKFILGVTGDDGTKQFTVLGGVRVGM